MSSAFYVMCVGRTCTRIYYMMRKNLVLFCALGALVFADGVAGIEWTRPADWKDQGSRPMRAATYSVPAAAGDNEAGECVAFYFGEGQGGSADANIKRWEGQFADASGKPVKATNVKPGKIGGLRVTTLEVAGTYSGMGGPMVQTKTIKPGYRLLGAIVEAPGGNVFFKFTGPEKTVAAHRQAFERMIASIKPRS